MDVDAHMGGKMKLSEYIHSKMGPSNAITWRSRTKEQIEEWMIQWYIKEFGKVPPMWITKGKKNDRNED